MARKQLKRSPVSSLVAAPSAARSDPRFNTALARGLDILRAFRPGDMFLGNTELSERTGIPASTMSRFTFTLQELGYLLYVEDLGRYQLGPGVLSLGFSMMATIGIQTIAHPLMVELAHACGGVVGLAAMDGLEMVYLEVVKGHAPVVPSYVAGYRIPVARTTLGWACLGGMNPLERKRSLAELERASGADWPGVKARIFAAFAELETRGFCLQVGGPYVPSVGAVGVPVHSHNDARSFSFNLTASATLVSQEDLENIWGPRLLALVRKIEVERVSQLPRIL
ncbi:Pca regulon regulatory protein [Variovorax sp. SRS16]|uniref:IclR family transcriptional regulator n=1 Tax=Variovorax sp. SRS16 TaxID=282217 RepID=UPI001319ABAE|nr:IclR family transcriptional regulator [Variovorax sp. SRS16]VTU13196.1 Pca regulon regulatory protein [Variovorax sp. SRS16]